jgi:hypothetical protein
MRIIGESLGKHFKKEEGLKDRRRRNDHHF